MENHQDIIPEKGITLIVSKTCPFAKRVHIIARQKQLTFNLIVVDLDNKSELFKNAYSKTLGKQPNVDAKVPILVDDNIYLTESDMISWYLIEKYRNVGTPILPLNPLQAFKMRLFISNYVNKLGAFVGGFFCWNKKSQEQRNKHKIDFQKYLQTLNNALTLPYALGDQFTLADVMLYPNLQRWQAIAHYTNSPIDKKYQKIYKFIEYVQKRQSVKACYQPIDVQIDGIKKFYN